MIARYAIVVVALLVASPALAENLYAEAARRFVTGKLFAFNCFDGSRGAGRIYGDGSVIGTIQFQGSGPIHSVWLPAGTLKVKGEAVCASIKGTPIEPCFHLNRTDDQSFRGSISGLSATIVTSPAAGALLDPSPCRLRRWQWISALSKNASQILAKMTAVPGKICPGPPPAASCEHDDRIHQLCE